MEDLTVLYLNQMLNTVYTAMSKPEGYGNEDDTLS